MRPLSLSVILIITYPSVSATTINVPADQPTNQEVIDAALNRVTNRVLSTYI